MIDNLHWLNDLQPVLVKWFTKLHCLNIYKASLWLNDFTKLHWLNDFTKLHCCSSYFIWLDSVDWCGRQDTESLLSLTDLHLLLHLQETGLVSKTQCANLRECLKY